MGGFFGSFVFIWAIFLLVFISIGGYFMFRKFLKSMPKQDGKSDLDWQDYYIEETKNLWTEETKQLLEELVQPVPELFRDVARRTIAGQIGKLAIEEKVKRIDQDLLIKGYIMATPARDHKFLLNHLEKKNIDYTPYRQYLKIKV